MMKLTTILSVVSDWLKQRSNKFNSYSISSTSKQEIECLNQLQDSLNFHLVNQDSHCFKFELRPTLESLLIAYMNNSSEELQHYLIGFFLTCFDKAKIQDCIYHSKSHGTFFIQIQTDEYPTLIVSQPEELYFNFLHTEYLNHKPYIPTTYDFK
jgi:hypothetical protein